MGTIYHNGKANLIQRPNSTKSIVENALLRVSPAFASTNIASNSSSLSTSTSETNSNSDPNIGGSNIITIGIPIAFVAGLLSFLSPCILPIIPSFVAFITGMSSEELLNKNSKRNTKSDKSPGFTTIDSNVDIKGTAEFEKQESIQKVSVIKSKTFIRGCLFILGFSLVFIALGASITAIGSAFHEYSRWIEIIGGIMIILFGLNLLGVLKIPGTHKRPRIQIH